MQGREAETEPNTANYTLVSPASAAGLPTVTASIKTIGPFGELVSRLWDVLPRREQRLLSRGVYRLAKARRARSPSSCMQRYEFAKATRSSSSSWAAMRRTTSQQRWFSVEVGSLAVSLPTP